jgi:hypothetical protein
MDSNDGNGSILRHPRFMVRRGQRKSFHRFSKHRTFPDIEPRLHENFVMKRIWVVVVIIAVTVGIWFWKKNSVPPKSEMPATSVSKNNSNAAITGNSSSQIAGGTSKSAENAAANLSQTNLALRAASPNPEPATNEGQKLSAFTILDNARMVIHNYHDAFGENPVGTNPEITAALTGQNSKQISFINPESGLRVNDNGELVDAWDAPFFFHQISRDIMEIRSAGPDKKMWTPDDSMTK